MLCREPLVNSEIRPVGIRYVESIACLTCAAKHSSEVATVCQLDPQPIQARIRRRWDTRLVHLSWCVL